MRPATPTRQTYSKTAAKALSQKTDRCKYYVVAEDKAMSCWGPLDGKKEILVVPGLDKLTAYALAGHLTFERADFARVRIAKRHPKQHESVHISTKTLDYFASFARSSWARECLFWSRRFDLVFGANGGAKTNEWDIRHVFVTDSDPYFLFERTHNGVRQTLQEDMTVRKVGERMKSPCRDDFRPALEKLAPREVTK